MEVHNKEIVQVPVFLDNDQEVIGMFNIEVKYEPDFGALCRELGVLPTMEQAEAWLEEIEQK